jgi:hypothetical protein
MDDTSSLIPPYRRNRLTREEWDVVSPVITSVGPDVDEHPHNPPRVRPTVSPYEFTEKVTGFSHGLILMAWGAGVTV